MARSNALIHPAAIWAVTTRHYGEDRLTGR